MKFKPGDVLWAKNLKCRVVVESTLERSDHHGSYRVFRVYQPKGVQKPRLLLATIAEEDLLLYFMHCLVCGKNIKIVDGHSSGHFHEGSLCYGSYLPLK